MSDSTPHRFTNALAKESSPYLLQHAHNPVHWMPWGAEAIAQAKAQDKPIFLSSGYSTCHWCHVMERESFENEDIAQVLNEHFICIKVDREERPDVDLTYMTYVQAATGGGGWPMSVFLTPELKPFFGGTYFPPQNQGGRIGFKNLLLELHKAWSQDRAKIMESAGRSIQKLQEHLDGENARQDYQATEVLQKAYDDLSSNYDYHEGGFSGAPKFPRSASIALLLRIRQHWRQREDRSSECDWALEMSLRTLRAMANGGIWDHVGGGFHRYSVDGYWHIPHYEKMLYDQGLLLWAYGEGFTLSQSAQMAHVCRQIASFAKRELRHDDGGFYSALDADSLASPNDREKREGAFYVWRATEIDELLGRDNGSIFRYAFGARQAGNARPESDPHGELKGTNTLFRAFSARKTAEYFKKDLSEVQTLLLNGLERLLQARDKRPRPHLDDKIITAWNGLMIAGLARAASALQDRDMLQLAIDAANFLRRQLCAQPQQGLGLHRSWRQGQRGPLAFASDYACLIAGLIDLHQASLDTQWLQWADALQQEMDRLFEDPQQGGYFSTHTDKDHSVLRIKEDYDGAEPSPNSMAAYNLARLGALLHDPTRSDKAQRLLNLFGRTLRDSPSAVPFMVCAADFLAHGNTQLVLAGNRQDPAFQAMLSEAQRRFMPHALLLHANRSDSQGDGKADSDSNKAQAWLNQHNPALAAMASATSSDGNKTNAPAAYLCENFTCKAPVQDLQALAQLLDQSQGKASQTNPAP